MTVRMQMVVMVPMVGVLVTIVDRPVPAGRLNVHLVDPRRGRFRRGGHHRREWIVDLAMVRPAVVTWFLG